MGRFAYFEYEGTLRPTIYSSYRKPFHYLVKVERDEADKHERTAEELKRAAGILILNKVGADIAEAIREGSPPKEVSRKRFEAMRLARVNRCTTMPGDVYEVLN